MDSIILIQENWQYYNLKTAFSMAFKTFLKEFPMQTETASRKTWETQISNGFNNPYTRELAIL